MSLNVLLLEDDPSKKTRLLSFLNTKKEFFRNVDTAICTTDALKLLKVNQYDLFIADIVVPINLGSEKHERNSIAVFEQLDDGVEDLLKPSFSVAVSAAGDLSSQAIDFYKGRPWGILPYSETTDEFLYSLEKIANFVITNRSKLVENHCCDILVITALIEPEYTAIEALGFEWGPFEPLDAYQLIRFGKTIIEEVEYRIGAVFCTRMGPVDAALLTVKASIKLNPKLIIMAGICAGIPGKAKIGDVIAADIAWDWQSGKYIDKNGIEGFQIAPHQICMDDQSKNCLLFLKRDKEFWHSLAPLAVKNKVDIPQLIIGPMASGSSVLADQRVVDRIKDNQHKNVAGLDMETYAVYAASHGCNPKTKVISMKSVCDLGDVKKNDEYQAYASSISAAAIHKFIQTYSKALLDS